MNDGSVIDVDSPAKLVDSTERLSVSEPYVALEMFAPKDYSGTLMELAQDRRGECEPTTPTSPTLLTPPWLTCGVSCGSRRHAILD